MKHTDELWFKPFIVIQDDEGTNKPDVKYIREDVVKRRIDQALHQQLKTIEDYVEQRRIDGFMPFYSSDFEQMFNSLSSPRKKAV